MAPPQHHEEMAPPQHHEEPYEELDIVEDSDEEEQKRPKSRVNNPRELRNLNTSYNPTFTDQVNLTLTS
jgi:hypothetical protein